MTIIQDCGTTPSMQT